MIKTHSITERLTLEDILREPDSILPTLLKEHRHVKIQQSPLMSEAGLNKLISQLTNGPVALKTPVLELTARKPYDATNGYMDMYMPGRWDTEDNLAYMQPIVVNPNSPGEWEGSVGYVTFNAPTTATYVMVLHFFGWQITMSLHGPGGTSTASSDSNTPSAVAMLFNGSGGPMGFSFNCTGLYLGFLQSVHVFQL